QGSCNQYTDAVGRTHGNGASGIGVLSGSLNARSILASRRQRQHKTRAARGSFVSQIAAHIASQALAQCQSQADAGRGIGRIASRLAEWLKQPPLVHRIDSGPMIAQTD